MPMEPTLAEKKHHVIFGYLLEANNYPKKLYLDGLIIFSTCHKKKCFHAPPFQNSHASKFYFAPPPFPKKKNLLNFSPNAGNVDAWPHQNTEMNTCTPRKPEKNKCRKKRYVRIEMRVWRGGKVPLIKVLKCKFSSQRAGNPQYILEVSHLAL